MKKFPLLSFGRNILLGFFLLAIISCIHEPQFIDELDPVCFETQILPIMQTSCALSGCHTGVGEENFNAADYNQLMQYVKPGDAYNSVLYKAITTLYGENIMPPDRPLSKSQRNLILIWIEQGALNTDCALDTNDLPPIPGDDTICFQQDILPLITSSCALSNCHDNITQREGFNFTNYTSIMANSDAVTPYQPNESELYQVLFETGEDRMPPSPYSPLTNEEKESIRKWISDGALNSDCPTDVCDTLNPISYSEQIWPVINTNCVGCHNNSLQSGSVNLSSYSNILLQVTTLRNDTPVIVGVIKQLPGFVPMPPSGMFDTCTIRTIELWIEQGSLNN